MLTALVVAAGQSERMSGLGEKTLMPILDRPLIVHTLAPFCRSRAVDQIVLVTALPHLAIMQQIVRDYGLHKVCAIIPGGKTRQESVYLGLTNVSRESSHVAIHDGARPCLGDNELQAVLQDGMTSGAAILAVPVKDTIKRVSLGVEVETPDRSELWAAQTPQVFCLAWIVAAHEWARSSGFWATDDAALLTAMGKAVHITQGAYTNIKVTTPEDLPMAEMILSGRCAR